MFAEGTPVTGVLCSGRRFFGLRVGEGSSPILHERCETDAMLTVAGKRDRIFMVCAENYGNLRCEGKMFGTLEEGATPFLAL